MKARTPSAVVTTLVASWGIASAGCASSVHPAPAPVTAATEAPRRHDPPETKSERPDPSLIQTTVRAAFPKMRACYEAGLVRDRKLAGRVAIKFVIERDGAVSGVEPYREKANELPVTPRGEAPALHDPVAIRCIEGEFRALRFPPPKGGSVTIVYPITFSPGD